MAMISTVAARSLLLSPLLQHQNARMALIRSATRTAVGFRPMTILSKQTAEEFKKHNYTARMKASGRPVSPHVTIYAFPVAAISSITNRVTGCIISFGCLGLGAAELVGGGGTSLFMMQWIASQGPLIAASAKFTVAFPVVYHYLGALRHFYWDYVPDSLTNDEVAKSSYILFGATTAISTGLMLV